MSKISTEQAEKIVLTEDAFAEFNNKLQKFLTSEESSIDFNFLPENLNNASCLKIALEVTKEIEVEISKQEDRFLSSAALTDEQKTLLQKVSRTTLFLSDFLNRKIDTDSFSQATGLGFDCFLHNSTNQQLHSVLTDIMSHNDSFSAGLNNYMLLVNHVLEALKQQRYHLSYFLKLLSPESYEEERIDSSGQLSEIIEATGLSLNTVRSIRMDSEALPIATKSDDNEQYDPDTDAIVFSVGRSEMDIEKIGKYKIEAAHISTLLYYIISNAARKLETSVNYKETLNTQAMIGIDINTLEYEGMEYLRIEVLDNGQAITKESMSESATPYQEISSKVANTISSASNTELTLDEFDTLFDKGVSGAGSSGIGLSEVKRMIEEINGSILIRNHKKEGVLVTVLIPEISSNKSDQDVLNMSKDLKSQIFNQN